MVWTEDSIGWMEHAALLSDYYRILASHIKKTLPHGAHICDVGCGLGHLSQALFLEGFVVSGVDISSEAIAHAKEKSCADLSFFLGDGHTFVKEHPFDALVFCQWGSADEIFRCFRESTARTFLAICRMTKERRCTVSPQGCPHRNAFYPLQTLLTERHISFSAEILDLTFPQPFRDLEDAVKFFRFYGKGHEDEISPQQVRKLLIPTDNTEFPLMFPIEKPVGIIIFHKKEGAVHENEKNNALFE